MRKLKAVTVVMGLLAVLLVITATQNYRLDHQVRTLTNNVAELNDTAQTTLANVEEINKKLPALTVNTDDPRVTKHGLNHISQDQIVRLIEIYSLADRVSEYSLTLAAIAWKESRMYSYPVNLSDPSCGPFHNKILNVLQREQIEDTPFKRNQICGMLINDLTFAVKHAVIELNFWHTQHRGNWRKMMASYNGGHGGNETYAEDVAEILDILRTSNINELVEEYFDATRTI